MGFLLTCYLTAVTANGVLRPHEKYMRMYKCVRHGRFNEMKETKKMWIATFKWVSDIFRVSHCIFGLCVRFFLLFVALSPSPSLDDIFFRSNANF